jgi:alpha-galactosidase
MQTWRLDTARQTLCFGAPEGGVPELIYWGAPLPGKEDLSQLARAHIPDVAAGMLDETPPLSLCPEVARGFPGQPGLQARDLSGARLLPRFTLISCDAGDSAITFRLADEGLALTLSLDLQIDADTHVVRAATRLRSATPIVLDWLAAPVFPASQMATEMVEFSGRWCGEFQTRNLPWAPGARLRDNPTGRSGHEHFPALIVADPGCSNSTGAATAFHYGWSGGHRMVAEELPDGRRQIQFGHASGSYGPGTEFETAPLYLTRSDQGLNACATAFQRHLRARISPPVKSPRPLHYNCWESVYFDHDLSELKDIADRAATLGAERFVLDDGWFGRRDDDTTSLGDWVVDRRKYPDGLAPLIDHIKALGMGFGLWFEPEMVNEDSDLFRAHPDWVLGPKDQPRGRQQLVLDMSRPQVVDHLYGQIAALLHEYDIEYIKWDHNRVLPGASAAQTGGTYALLDRLRAACPQVEIESCASGGGRVDFGILQRCGRVWLSDSNDALERMRIQHDAALFLPASVTGSHVGPRRCHTSGRVIDMATRSWVAAQRHMGFEMDPRELTEDEAATLRQVASWWKLNRDWMQEADILRLDHADPAVVAELQLAQDGHRFVVFAGQRDTSAQILPRPLRLTGLEPLARYEIELINRGDTPALSRGTPALKSAPLILSGAYLMGSGLTLPWSFPQTIRVIEGRRL